GQLQFAAKQFYSFIGCKSWIVRSNFKQDSSRFTEIKGEEIIPVDFFSNMKSPCKDFLSESHQYFFIFYPKCNVVICSSRINSSLRSRALQQIHQSRAFDRIGLITVDISVLCHQLVTEHLC